MPTCPRQDGPTGSVASTKAAGPMPAMPKPVQLRSTRYHLHYENSEADGAGWGRPVTLRAALTWPQLLAQVLLQRRMWWADTTAGCQWSLQV